MKIFRYICAIIIFAIGANVAIFCKDITNFTFHTFYLIIFLCGFVVLFDGFQQSKEKTKCRKN